MLLDDSPFILQLDGCDDSILDEIDDNDIDPVEESNKQLSTPINIINTNARSLCPKIDSLIDCFEEMDVTLGIVTETWLADGESLDRDVQDLAKGAGLDMLCLNRAPNGRGVAHRGVAIVANNAACKIKRIDLPNPGAFEVLVALSSIPGYSRKLLTVACYLPPNYAVPRGRDALDHIENVVRELKRRYRDPFIVVGGDFNQWAVQDALAEFPDLREMDVGPTRHDRCIDILFTNFGRSVTDSGTVPPLEPEPGHQGTRSDHRLAFIKAELPRARTFEWVTYQYRYFNGEAMEEFGRWLARKDWVDVVMAPDSNTKANVYQEAVSTALEECFPLIARQKEEHRLPLDK